MKNIFTKYLLIGLVLTALVLPSACAEPAPLPSPAEFEISSLVITPPEAVPAEPVTISVDVNNTGESEGTYPITLTLNGVKTQTKVVKVAPESTEKVSFIVTKDKPGIYSVGVNGLSGTLSVSPISVPIYSNPQTYRVIRTFTVQNETAGVDLLKVWMPTVVDWDSQRNVVTEETIPPPNGVWDGPQSRTGVSYWEFHGRPGKGSSLTITDQFIYTCYEVNYDIEPKQITAYDKDDSEYMLFTRSEKYLEANDLEIMETAKSLAGDETNPCVVANSIYEWVIDHMTYQLLEDLGGAKFAFENGYGECVDYSALFVALCRAAGIPARPVIGRWATFTGGTWDWHGWAEFYLPGYGWIPVDPTVGDIPGKREDYFGRLDNKRLIFNKQYNIVLHPRPYFIASEWAFLQTWIWEYQGFPGTIQADLDYSIKPIASD